LDFDYQITNALWDKVDQKYRMVITDEKWGNLGKNAKALGGDSVSETLARNVRDAIDYIRLTPEEMSALAGAGAAKRGWDIRGANSFKTMFGKDSDIVVDLVAATSPSAKVIANYEMAMKLFKEWNYAGRPTGRDAIIDVIMKVPGAKMLGRAENIIRSFKRQPLEGEKVSNWSDALKGNPNALTHDLWIALATGIPQESLSKAVYMALSIQFRRAAEIRGWSPSETSETLWSFVKGMFDSKLINKTGLKLGSDVTKAVYDVPEYATAMKIPKIRELLKKAGVPEELIDKSILEAETGLANALKDAESVDVDPEAFKSAIGKLQDAKKFKDKLESLPNLNFSKKMGADEFVKGRDMTKKPQFLAQYKAADYKKMKATTYLDESGKVGYALKKDGEIISVFNNSGIKNLGMRAMENALKNGGTHLDCIGEQLKEYYEQFGFKAYDELAWDDLQAPVNWDYKELGRPTIFRMRTMRVKPKKGES
jgi:hypothetical protein